MASKWITTEKPENDKFDDFTIMYKTFLAEKTDNIQKLKIRIQKTWQVLSFAEKRDYQDRLINLGLIDSDVVRVLDLFGGTITAII